MAGDWIKFETATLDKPEVLMMAETLKLSPDEVVGKLLRVWSWFDKNSVDGNAGGVTGVTLMSHIDRLVGLETFASAMKKVGWLGTNGVPHFDRHNGKSAKKRALGADRAANHRNASSNASRVTSALPEKRREEKNKSETTPATSRDTQPGSGQSAAGAVSEEHEPNPKVRATVDALRVGAGAGTDDYENAGSLFAVLKANSCKGTPQHPQVIEWVRQGVTVSTLRAAIAKARETTSDQLNPAYLAPIVERILAGGGKPNGKGQAWATNESACEAKARELGLWPARGGESWDELRGRIRKALAKQAEESVQ